MDPIDNKHACRVLHDIESGMYCYCISTVEGQLIELSEATFDSSASALEAGNAKLQFTVSITLPSVPSINDSSQTRNNVVDIRSQNSNYIEAKTRGDSVKSLGMRILSQYPTPPDFVQTASNLIESSKVDQLNNHEAVVHAYRGIVMGLAISLATMYEKHPQDLPAGL